MAVSHQAVFVQTPKITPQTFANADSTNKKTLFTAGSDGSKIVAINAASTDGTARNLALWITRSAVNYLIGTVNIPITAGSTGAISSINILGTGLIPSLPVDNDNQSYIFLESGDTLQGSFLVAVTAAAAIDVITIGANF